MPSKLTADEVLTQQHVRGFVTYGRPRPGNQARYYGVQGSQYFFVGGVSNPVQGSISAINVPDPYRRKAYRMVGRQIEAPDLGAFDLMVAHKHGSVPRVLGNLADCPLTVHLTTGRCVDPSDLNRGYEDWLYILSNGLVTDRDNGDMFPMDSDEMLQTSLSVTTAEQYAVGPLSFGEVAGPEVNAEVLDIVYAPPRGCEDCPDGADRIYAIAAPIGASPSFQAEVVYSVDGGTTWANVNITGLSAAAIPTAIDIVGGYLVVLVNSTDSLYYAQLDADTGAPGTWTAVTTGFVAAGSPNDLYVASPSEVWIAGDSGYIYRSRDITAGVTAVVSGTLTSADYRRIHGMDSTIVAVGESGQVAISQNSGGTWGTPTAGTPTSETLTAVAVKDSSHFWLGAGNGDVFYTLTGGKSWVEDAGVASGAVSVQDIVFATDHVGYVAYTVTGTEARLGTTVDGGDTWATGVQRVIGSFPVFDRANRIAVPASDAQTASNYVALAGLAGDGSEGFIGIGQANIV